MGGIEQLGTGVVITYHEVVNGQALSDYTCTAQEFESHLQRVKSFPGVQVSFDDGHGSNYQVALPALESHGIKATFFVSAGLVGVRPDFMNWSQVRELAEKGHRVQSHSWHHRFLTGCSDAELADELTRSKNDIAEHTGQTVDSISMPGGRVDDRVLEACATAGYRFAYTSDPWIDQVHRTGIHVKGRFMMRRNMSSELVHRILQADSALLANMKRKNLVRRLLRGIIGEAAYQQLWFLATGRKNVRSQDEYS